MLAGLVLAGCTGVDGARPSAPASTDGTGSARSVPSGSEATERPTVPASARPTTTTSSPAPETTAPNPVSIQALIDQTYDGSGLKLGAERGSTSAYRQYYATYRGSGLTISGRINIPRGDGPFPAVVLAHGYVDPREYTNGQTMFA